MKAYLINLILCLVLSFTCGIIFIKIAKRKKIGQTILKYVETHKGKNGTPTMGGLFFIAPSCLCFLVLYGFNDRLSLVSVCIGLAFMMVGFIDDYIKIRSHDNQGLKPYQKIGFQSAIALIAGLFCYFNGITNAYLPFLQKKINLNYFVIPIVFVVFIAITNSVNLTDGLDSLAGGTSLVYLAMLLALIYVQNLKDGGVFIMNNYKSLVGLSFCMIGGLLAFLIFNVSKARVFMGDTGSLSLGGFLGCISIFTGNTLIIPILGITFVCSAVSVIIQVLVYKKTKKRVFLMAPLHHHLQMKGWSETQVSYVYALVTGIIGVLLVICYL